MIWLFRTGCALSKGRGVQGCGNSRMGFRVSSQNGLISSQGTPQRLEKRRKRHRTENSSIHLLFFLGVALSQGVGAIPVRAQGKVPSRAEQIQAVANGYEQMFLSQLFDQMRRSGSLLENANDGNPFAPSSAEKIFRGFQDQALIENLSRSRPLGVGRIVEDQLMGRSGVRRSGLGTANGLNQFDLAKIQEPKSPVEKN